MTRSLSKLVGSKTLPNGITGPKGELLQFQQDGSLLMNTAATGKTLALTYAEIMTLPFAESNQYTLTLTGDLTIQNPAVQKDGNWTLILSQNAIGNHVVSFGSRFSIAQGAVGLAGSSRTLVQIVGVNGEYHVSMTSIAPA